MSYSIHSSREISDVKGLEQFPVLMKVKRVKMEKRVKKCFEDLELFVLGTLGTEGTAGATVLASHHYYYF